MCVWWSRQSSCYPEGYRRVTVTNANMLIQGIGGNFMPVPLHRVNLKCDLFTGPVDVGVAPILPMKGVGFLLGNDVVGGNVSASPIVSGEPVNEPEIHSLEEEFPEIFPECAVTRSQKKQTEKEVAESVPIEELPQIWVRFMLLYQRRSAKLSILRHSLIFFKIFEESFSQPNRGRFLQKGPWLTEIWICFHSVPRRAKLLSTWLSMLEEWASAGRRIYSLTYMYMYTLQSLSGILHPLPRTHNNTFYTATIAVHSSTLLRTKMTPP